MRKQVNLWTQKNKTRIRICDMEDHHTVSCVNMLRRWGELKKLEADLNYLKYITPQGEHAQIAFDQECSQVWNREWHEYVPKIFWNIIKDIQRRAVLRPGIIDNLIGIPNWIVRD